MVMLILAVGCHKREAETPPAIPSGGALSPEVEYARLRTELSLADSGQPYLVLNVPDTLLEVRLKGTPVWTTRLDLIESDRGDLDRFTRKFTGGSKTWVRPVAGLHLFAAQEKTPDSVLAIVSEALNVKKELLQRDVPERFRIYWSESLMMDVVSEIEGRPRSTLANRVIEARTALRKPFGAARITVRLAPDDALTLHRLTEPGLATLLLHY